MVKIEKFSRHIYLGQLFAWYWFWKCKKGLNVTLFFIIYFSHLFNLNSLWQGKNFDQFHMFSSFFPLTSDMPLLVSYDVTLTGILWEEKGLLSSKLVIFLHKALIFGKWHVRQQIRRCFQSRQCSQFQQKLCQRKKKEPLDIPWAKKRKAVKDEWGSQPHQIPILPIMCYFEVTKGDKQKFYSEDLELRITEARKFKFCAKWHKHAI